MLNPIEEVKFAELKDKCRELGVPAPPEIMIGLKVHDKNGILTFDDIQRGHSWTRNFYNIMFHVLTICKLAAQSSFGAGYMSLKSTSGAIAVSTDIRSYAFVPYEGALSVSNGIVVGTDDTAFSVEQYALGALIAHGNGSGQLAHSAGVISADGYAAKIWKSTAYRIFNNNSGSSITIKEVGIYGGQKERGYSSLWMIERSVLSPTVAVANGAQLTVTYEISMDFSAID